MKAPTLGRSVRLQNLRPVLSWIVISGILLAWQFHRTQELEARVRFTVTLDGKQVSSYRSSLNETAFASGDVSGLGRKTLTIIAPDAEPFETNFSVRYGGASLGAIKLERSRGTVVLNVVPKAKVRITGDHFQKELENCGDESLLLPIGDYEIETTFKRFTVKKFVEVRRNRSETVQISPGVVSLELSSEPADAKFRIQSKNYKQIEIEGATPATLDALPAGEYDVVAWRDDYRKTRSLYLTEDPTNRIVIEFEYAAVSIHSDPPDATIMDGDHVRGKTPVTLALAPRTYWLRIEKEGHYPTNIQFTVSAPETRQFQLGLANIAFTESMANARSLALRERVDYARALAEVDKALKFHPRDEGALQLRANLDFGQHLSKANDLRNAGNFADALVEVHSALKIGPKDIQALALKEALQVDRSVAEEQKLRAAEADVRAKTRAAEADARAKEEARRKLPHDVFAQTLRGHRHHELFNEHVMVVKGSRDTVVETVVRALSRNPEWTVGRNQTPDSEIEIIQAERKFIGMKYNAVLVAGQTADNEVTMYFKILAFIIGGKIEISLGGISGGGYVPYHPQHSSVSPNAIATQISRDVDQFKLRIERELR